MKELIYKVIDLITLGKGLNKKFRGYAIKLPTRFINYFPSDYESENFLFLEKQIAADDVVLDIGAHIGLFSVIAAQIVGDKGKVFAFEPAPSTARLLKKTIHINHLENVVQPFAEAMSKEVGAITFFVSDNKADNSNSLVSYKSDRQLNGIEVKVNTIDHFVDSQHLSKVTFIKIDVEGAEYDTLLGGRKTFTTHRPACILAIHPEPIKVKGDKLEDIYNFIQQINYCIVYNNQQLGIDAFCSNTEMIDLQLLPL